MPGSQRPLLSDFLDIAGKKEGCMTAGCRYVFFPAKHRSDTLLCGKGGGQKWTSERRGRDALSTGGGTRSQELSEASSDLEESHSFCEPVYGPSYLVYNFMKLGLLLQRADSPEIEPGAKFLSAGVSPPPTGSSSRSGWQGCSKRQKAPKKWKVEAGIQTTGD